MDPTPIPIPLPVDFGPTVTDWMLVWLTLFSAIASSIVALMAYLGSRHARRIALEATEAERSRLERADRERAADRFDRLQRSYARHMAALGEHSSNLSDFIRRSRALRVGSTPDPGPQPNMNAAIADLHALRVFAEEDRGPLGALLALENSLSSSPPLMQLETLASLVPMISRWRIGELSLEQFESRLATMQEAVDAVPGH